MTTPPTPAQIAAEMNRIMTDDKTLTEIRNMAEYNLTQPARAESETSMKIEFSTDNRRALAQDRYDLVFFRVGGEPKRYTELTPEQQFEAGKIYPVTFQQTENANLTTRVAELEAGLREIATVKEHLDNDRMRETCGYEAVLMRDLARRLLESK